MTIDPSKLGPYIEELGNAKNLGVSKDGTLREVEQRGFLGKLFKKSTSKASAVEKAYDNLMAQVKPVGGELEKEQLQAIKQISATITSQLSGPKSVAPPFHLRMWMVAKGASTLEEEFPNGPESAVRQYIGDDGRLEEFPVDLLNKLEEKVTDTELKEEIQQAANKRLVTDFTDTVGKRIRAAFNSANIKEGLSQLSEEVQQAQKVYDSLPKFDRARITNPEKKFSDTLGVRFAQDIDFVEQGNAAQVPACKLLLQLSPIVQRYAPELSKRVAQQSLMYLLGTYQSKEEFHTQSALKEEISDKQWDALIDSWDRAGLLSGIRKLDFQYFPFDNGPQIEKLLAHCPNLEDLNFVTSVNAQHFAITNFKPIFETTDPVLNMLSDKCPKLKVLKLGHNNTFTAAVLQKTLSKLKHLENLSISKTDLNMAKAEDLFQALMAHGSLKIVQFSSFNKVTDDQFIKLVKKGVNVKGQFDRKRILGKGY